MNYRCADVVFYTLRRAWFSGTEVTAVADSQNFSVTDASGFSIGDDVVVSRAGTEFTVSITNIVLNVLTVAPGVTGVAMGDPVRLLIGAVPTYTLHDYKDIDVLTGEPPALEAPFIGVFLPTQMPPLGPRKANQRQTVVLDYTDVAIQVEARQVIADGTTLEGGFDNEFLPAVEWIKQFIEDNATLDIPAAIASKFTVTVLSMMPDPTQPEVTVRPEQTERYVAYVRVGYFDKTK